MKACMFHEYLFTFLNNMKLVIMSTYLSTCTDIKWVFVHFFTTFKQDETGHNEHIFIYIDQVQTLNENLFTLLQYLNITERAVWTAYH